MRETPRGPVGFYCHTRPVLIMRGLIQLQRDPLHDAIDLSARGPAAD